MLSLHDGCDDPLWWLLITSGYRTYRFLPLFFQRSWPRVEAQLPGGLRALRDALAVHVYRETFDATDGLVRLARPQPLRAPLAGIPPGRSTHDRDLAFFLAQNPGHVRGDELVCLAQCCRSHSRPPAGACWANPRWHKMNPWCGVALRLWGWSCRPELARFRRALNDPAAAQRGVLERILRQAEGSAFATHHRLHPGLSPEDFAQRVSIIEPHELEPWVARIKAGEPRVSPPPGCSISFPQAVPRAAPNSSLTPTHCSSSSDRRCPRGSAPCKRSILRCGMVPLTGPLPPLSTSPCVTARFLSPSRRTAITCRPSHDTWRGPRWPLTLALRACVVRRGAGRLSTHCANAGTFGFCRSGIRGICRHCLLTIFLAGRGSPSSRAGRTVRLPWQRMNWPIVFGAWRFNRKAC